MCVCIYKHPHLLSGKQIQTCKHTHHLKHYLVQLKETWNYATGTGQTSSDSVIMALINTEPKNQKPQSQETGLTTYSTVNYENDALRPLNSSRTCSQHSNDVPVLAFDLCMKTTSPAILGKLQGTSRVSPGAHMAICC